MDFNQMREKLKGARSNDERIRLLAENLLRRKLAMTMSSARQLAESMILTEERVQKVYQERKERSSNYGEDTTDKIKAQKSSQRTSPRSYDKTNASSNNTSNNINSGFLKGVYSDAVRKENGDKMRERAQMPKPVNVQAHYDTPKASTTTPKADVQNSESDDLQSSEDEYLDLSSQSSDDHEAEPGDEAISRDEEINLDNLTVAEASGEVEMKKDDGYIEPSSEDAKRDYGPVYGRDERESEHGNEQDYGQDDRQDDSVIDETSNEEVDQERESQTEGEDDSPEMDLYEEDHQDPEESGEEGREQDKEEDSDSKSDIIDGESDAIEKDAESDDEDLESSEQSSQSSETSESTSVDQDGVDENLSDKEAVDEEKTEVVHEDLGKKYGVDLNNIFNVNK